MDGEQGVENLTESTREFALANGRKLHLRPLRNLSPVRKIYIELAKLGGVTGLQNASELKESDQTKLISLYQQLSAYVIGWGTSDELPPDTDEVLIVLELEPRENLPNINRANWLMFCEISGDEERQELINAIMAITTETQPSE